MKKILLALFLVSSVLAFSARVVKSTETVVKENIVYVGQEKAPYTGVVESYGDNGVLAGKAEFKDKKIYLFGTFGWGTGQFMGTWIKQVEELGAKIVELPMACKGSPNSETKEKLTNMAKKIATM